MKFSEGAEVWKEKEKEREDPGNGPFLFLNIAIPSCLDLDMRYPLKRLCIRKFKNIYW